MTRRMRSLAVLLCVASSACGARSGLGVPTRASPDAGLDAAVPPRDAYTADAPTCAPIGVTFRETVPTMIFVIDRSGSMEATYREPTTLYRGASRWEMVVEVLVGDSGILFGMQDRVRLGAITFTSDTECPALDSVDPALHSADAISRMLHRLGPEGGTPIAETMMDISSRLGSLSIDGSPPTLVLMTDGEPAGCGLGDDPTPAVTACFDAGARTYVIGVGDDVGDPYLISMANAGAGVRDGEPDAEFWPAAQAGRFVEAVDAIARRIADCRATLSLPIDPERACEGELRLDDRVVPCGSADGWAALDERTIELRGDACTALVRAGTARVILDEPCDVRR